MAGNLGSPRQANALPGLLSLAGSSIPWIAGGLVHDRLLRGGLWALALAIEFPGFVVGFSTGPANGSRARTSASGCSRSF
ncbi:hypothetical protein GCM10010169_35550 [Micromonospora fulviviridis]|nr:hypothetical protein GCM10010169_35550 [Micromonospora fulviviridis]